MSRLLPDFPPLFPTGEWWRAYVAARLAGDERPAEMIVGNMEGGARRRDWMRIAIAGGQTLSVPVEGGASALKNRDPRGWRLAPEASREGRKAAATLATVYGRHPYFHLLSDMLPADLAVPGAPARGVCLEAFRTVESLLGLDDPTLLAGLRRAVDGHDRRIGMVGADCRGRLRPGLSILDAVFTLGRDAIFALLPPF